MFLKDNVINIFKIAREYLVLNDIGESKLSFFNDYITIDKTIEQCYSKEFDINNCMDLCQYFQFNNQEN